MCGDCMLYDGTMRIMRIWKETTTKRMFLACSQKMIGTGLVGAAAAVEERK